MAESIERHSDNYIYNENVNYCEQCFDSIGEKQQVVGFCEDCHSNLCLQCFTVHIRPKPFRNHRLVEKTIEGTLWTKSESQSAIKSLKETCPRHHVEIINSFCNSHSEMCCNLCLTFHHQNCDTKEISKMATDIKDSKNLEKLHTNLTTLMKGLYKNLSKKEENESSIQKHYAESMGEISKVREQFEKLMTESEKQAEKVKEEDLKSMEKLSKECNIIIEQINKIASNLDLLQDKGENERVFIAMKRAESELKSLEESLHQFDKDNVIREYQFEPDFKLKSILTELKTLGQLSFGKPLSGYVSGKSRSILEQMDKTAKFDKDINIYTYSEHGSTVQLNNLLLMITDGNNKKLSRIDPNQGQIIHEIKLSAAPLDVTNMESEKVAITVNNPNKILLISINKNCKEIEKHIKVNGKCRGIVYNDKDKTFVVTFYDPAKVEIIGMTGDVIRSITQDSNGTKLFANPSYVALSPDRSRIYVSDYSKHSVTLMTMNGDVISIFQDSSLKSAAGLCVHKSGLVYVVGSKSNTVHQIEPDSGKFKLLLDQKNKLATPWSISYCETQDKMYVGMYYNNIMKVFHMDSVV